MSLSGKLTDLSFAELIEFFCNQKKTGRLEVICPGGRGEFYLCDGSIMHAEIGVLRGTEAVLYALTLCEASFSFEGSLTAPEQTIGRQWAPVVLEGLRRLDEGVIPAEAFPDWDEPSVVLAVEELPAIESCEELPAVESRDELLVLESQEESPVIESRDEMLVIESGDELPPLELAESHATALPSFLLHPEAESPSDYSRWKLVAAVAAVMALILVIAVPWYTRNIANAGKKDVPAVESQSQKTENSPAANSTTSEFSKKETAKDSEKK